MTNFEIQTHAQGDTIKLGEKLSLLLRPGSVVTLTGQLGSGKTTFVKGLAAGLGVTDMITSPTFTIVKEYNGELPLYHMDVYRLEHSEEDIGFTEYFEGNGISVVEWAEFIKEYLPGERLDIEIKYIDEHSRMIIFNPRGSHYERVVESLLR